MAAGALDASVLVLNRSFAPVNLVTVRRAFGMLFSECAEVVWIEGGQVDLYDFPRWVTAGMARRNNGGDQDHAEWVSTVSLHVQVPRIVRLMAYNRYPESRVSLNRRNVLARDEHRCQYCGRTFGSHDLSMDHVVPLSRGGRTSWTNVVTACRRCNRNKGWRTPQEAGMSLLRKPGEPRFDPLIRLKLRHEKYDSWRMFISESYWPVTAE